MIEPFQNKETPWIIFVLIVITLISWCIAIVILTFDKKIVNPNHEDDIKSELESSSEEEEDSQSVEYDEQNYEPAIEEERIVTQD